MAEAQDQVVTIEALVNKYEQRLQSLSANVAVLRQAQQIVGDKVSPELSILENVISNVQEIVADLKSL